MTNLMLDQVFFDFYIATF